MKEKGLRISSVTKKVGYTRGSFYLHIKKEDLSLDILKEYGKAIGHDFSNEIPEIKNLTEDEHAPYTKETVLPALEEVTRDRDTWRNKYYELSDRYNELSDKYMKLIEPKENNQP